MAPASKSKRPQQTRLKTPQKPTPRTNVSTSAAKTKPKGAKPKPNQSILSFFKKAPVQDEELFIGAGVGQLEDGEDKEEDLYEASPTLEPEGRKAEDEGWRYNEARVGVKRRKLTPAGSAVPLKRKDTEEFEGTEEKTVVFKATDDASAVAKPKAKPTTAPPASNKKKAGNPFLDDSSDDSSDEYEADEEKENEAASATARVRPPQPAIDDEDPSPHHNRSGPAKLTNGERISREVPLLRPETSGAEVVGGDNQLDHEIKHGLDNDGNLPDANDDMLDDDFTGEELRAMRYMEEQARLEAEENGEEYEMNEFDDGETMAESCPVCNGSLAGATSDQATAHVNSCLDGNPTPLPKPPGKESPGKVDFLKAEAAAVGKRFAKAAVPRPPQANPFSLGDDEGGPANSAFTKLMSGHAEDSAWATAAAAETASRGLPAYKRTCPFYKIMPDFSICVDAFRYGAVEGCQAYFLSHFHSDHYIGLTANWTHGPIYCSNVTGSLVKSQLRTAAKYVVELEFEKTVPVPNTKGVTVTMIPANHCPGSSLFLFEKTTGSRTQRILHCGDFRACPAHVEHPKLRPETVDAITGRTKQQKIDVCYLDTTYLNPRYSFPPQDDVIRACAELCTQLNKSLLANDDRMWNALLRRQLCGTYSIGKERICVAVAQALQSKIFASAAKRRICAQLDDPELSSLLTSNPAEAQVHMQTLADINAEALREYLDGVNNKIKGSIGKCPPSPNLLPPCTSCHPFWNPRYSAGDMLPQRGGSKEAMCFGVPYSEHSSFRSWRCL
ncbi:DNA cross-link repair protein PSO2/SNM1 [Collariella sp. IMI 366227]|nr:DNA cross-link repair protein PSO2/SNM1 [Collariella sp. IMI 366227]